MSFLYPLLVGSAAGIIDITPMVLRRMNRYSVLSAFIFHLTAPCLLSVMNIPLAPWLKGMSVYLILILPTLIIVAKEEKRSIPIIVINTLVIGGIAGWALSLR